MPAPIIGAILSRLLASRIGSSTIGAASRMSGIKFGGLAGSKSADAGNALASRARLSAKKMPKISELIDLDSRKQGGWKSRGSIVTADMVRPASRAASNFSAIMSQRMHHRNPTPPPIQHDGLRSRATPQPTPVQSDGMRGGGGQGLGLGDLAKSMNPGVLLAGTLKDPRKAALGVTGVFATLAATGKKLAESQVEQLRHLRAFNGTIAASYARMDRGNILRQRSSASNTSASTAALVESVNEMKDAIQPIKDSVTNVVNSLLLPATVVVKHLAWIYSLIGEWTSWDKMQREKNEKREMNPWEKTIFDLAKHYRERNDPKRRRR